MLVPRATRWLCLAVAIFCSTAAGICGAAERALAPAAFSEEIVKQDKIYKSRGTDTPQGYVIDRALATYAFAFGGSFEESLAKLGTQDRWLDIGAGEARAIIDYTMADRDTTAEYTGVLGPHKARVVAMSIEDRRTRAWHQAAAIVGPDRMQYLMGRTLSDYSPLELGKYRLVTDLMGGFSYTVRISSYMRTMLALLEIDGDFYATLADVHAEGSDNKPYYEDSPYLTEIVSKSGAEVKVCSWLRQISCVRVACRFRSDWTPPIEVYHVRKTCDQVKVPMLEMIHFESGTPPERKFQLLDDAPAASARTMTVTDTAAASRP